MTKDYNERHRVLNALCVFVQTVKSEVLACKRSEDDYPVTLEAALDHLAKRFIEEPASDCATDGADPKPSPTLVRILESQEWDQGRLGRKQYGRRSAFRFFLPGDEYFTELPRSEKAYVRLLFELERKSVPRPEEEKKPPEKAPSPDSRTFEMEVRQLYERILRRTRGATYIRIPELRREMKLAREHFDSGLLRLRDKGQVILSKHGYAASLTPQDRDGCIEVSPGDYYYYLEFRGL